MLDSDLHQHPLDYGGICSQLSVALSFVPVWRSSSRRPEILVAYRKFSVGSPSTHECLVRNGCRFDCPRMIDDAGRGDRRSPLLGSVQMQGYSCAFHTGAEGLPRRGYSVLRVFGPTARNSHRYATKLLQECVATMSVVSRNHSSRDSNKQCVSSGRARTLR